jgi:hypothetical protein
MQERQRNPQPKGNLNGEAGRDAKSGRFAPGNEFGTLKRRGRGLLAPVPTLPRRLQRQGLGEVWTMLATLAATGNATAIRIVTNLALGKVEPEPLSQQAYDALCEQDEQGG